ncbi:MAG: Na+ dependent nucleoside transporter N-terminal domain-containing protein, partial [Flavobacteriaceae bacterium]
MKQFFTCLAFIMCTIAFGQDITDTWQFDSIKNTTTQSTISVTDTDVLTLDNNTFEYQLKAKNNLRAKGDYILQNDLLIFYYTQPNDTIRRYRITEHTDSTLVFTEHSTTYAFVKKQTEEVVAAEAQKTNDIIPSQGFSFDSLWRGVLGMVSLIFIAFLFSSDRKNINWKTIGIGLAFQLIIAISVLKVPFIQGIFEWIGQLFVSVLDFTRAGSEFLFQGLVVDMDTFGFIFAFQVLPTILFFSALTSVLFYLGIIQKVVKGMAWALSKILKISGAESLSVAGNIF